MSKQQVPLQVDMDYWDVSCKAGDEDDGREPGFFWHDHTATPSDIQGVGDGDDLFGQFVDFDDPHPSGFLNMNMGMGLSMNGGNTIPGTIAVPGREDPFLLDQPSDSIGSSTGDDLDFLSNSTDVDNTTSSVYDVDPRAVNATNLGRQQQQQQLQQQQQQQHFGQQVYVDSRASASDTDLPYLEGITLSSPTRRTFHSPSPPKSSAPNATPSKTSRIVDAVNATIRKATGTNGRRKPRKPLPQMPARPDSPILDDEQEQLQIRAPRQRPRQRNMEGTNGTSEVDLQAMQQNPGAKRHFVQGPCDDPFHNAPSLPPPTSAGNMMYDHGAGVSPPLISPAIKSETSGHEGIWPQTAQLGAGTPGGTPWDAIQTVPTTPTWWEFNGQQPVSEMNMAALHAQQQFAAHASFQDTGSSGLMIHIPHPHMANADVNLSPHTQMMPANMTLPPHPPPPPPPAERSNRPPKAPSSGARHLSHSPVRRTRARSRAPSASASGSASASPTRCTTNPHHARQSSHGSISSTRSASAGRLPASMPGTPCSVRKRRSRDPSGSGSVSGGGGGGGGGSSADIGFVNFTPSDGGMLMTGVAPSGSSKTKARREKEAAERRKKMNEAAIRAIEAAGGDVNRLMQQGFAF